MSLPKYSEYKDSGVAWLGQLPGHWKIFALKRLANLQSGNGITAESIEEYGDFPVYGGNGLRGYTSSFTHEGRYVLIGRQGALCGNINYSEGKFWASEHAVVASPCKPANTTWLGELLRTMNLNQYSVSAAQPGLSVEIISNLAVPYPPLEEQSAIAAFLDRETAKIDALIAEQEKLLTLLAEKRQATISRAVTKGLNPDAPMKDSGVEWLGEVPAHWEVTRLKYLGEAIIGLTYDPSDVSNNDEGTLVLRSSNVQQGQITFDDKVFVSSKIPDRLRTIEGDILLCSRNGSRSLIGKNALITKQAEGLTFGAFMTIFRGRFNPYLRWVFNSQIFAYQAGTFLTSTINQLTTGNLYSFEVPLPGQGEQAAIAAFLEEETKKIDALKSQAERAIAFLTERRGALIAAAVTGKIDVRGAVTQQKVLVT